MLPTHDVPCPYCRKALYSSTSLEDGVNTAAPSSPRVKRDEHGHFMSCPHCGRRVAMVKVAVGRAEETQPR